MKVKVMRVDPVEMGKFWALYMGCFALIAAVILGFVIFAESGALLAIFTVAGVVAAYLALGLLFGIIFAWIINFIFKRMGGLTIEFKKE